ncbi:hypothetical protein HG536_0C00970 [Torulaspora globosa]|uniref:Uncharacterized protein n=1 Tax=Torulaspora globosa TaxID=48254 RepID=A0A7G3ZEJ4_9SACH|nr:uncharacterized protein HG536_0C00970 [Torulaspora globosa]QLL31930.1 hypothetical protein HG536_0C00970 [Torulaspora globosa]
MNVEIEHVQLDFVTELERNICSLRVQANALCFALKNGLIFLIDLDSPSAVSKFSIPLVTASNNCERLIDMWLSPDASKLFVKTNFAKYYLCDVASMKERIDKGLENSRTGIFTVRKLLKKNCDIKVVDWGRDGNMLCGTIDGQVFYIEIVGKNGKQKSDPDVSIIYKSNNRIDGILWDGEGHLVLASGNSIAYWKNVTIKRETTLGEPPETEEFEQLHKETSRKFASHEDMFAWITQTGILFGSIKDKSKVLSNAKVFLTVELPESKHNIRDIMLTEHHIIVLRGCTVTFINQLSNSVVFEESILNEAGERMIGLTADYSQDVPTFWCFSNTNIYEIVLSNESQAVWRLLSEQHQYDAALKLRDLTDLQRQELYFQKACYLLDVQDRPVEAARCFGKSFIASTTSIALKLLNSRGNTESLQVFLLARLDSLTSKDQVQRILLSSWIVWTFMKLLNDTDEGINTERQETELKQLNEQKDMIEERLRKFFETHLECMDKETVYQILEEQNRKQALLFFAKLIKDHDYVLSYWVRQENWYEALRTLLDMQDPESVYKYATILLVNSPEATIHTWMKIAGVNPIQLIPSALTYFTNFQKQLRVNEHDKHNFALTYLLWCIEEQEFRQTILFNTALYMMISQGSPIGEEEIDSLRLIRFLDAHEGYYDKDYILRLSVKFRKVEVSIYLYTQLKLYEDAVMLALENNMIPSAKLVVNNKDLECDPKLRKFLWLQIARSMLSQEDGSRDVKHTMRTIISESNEILEVKDLLPLFDEFTTIANLKDELIRSLEKHGRSMRQISEQIKHSVVIKKEILRDIESFKERYAILEPGVSCSRCQRVLQTRKFLAFPCGHCFHTDCLIRAILDSNDYNLKSKIESFQRRMAKDKNSVKAEELEALIAAKCCLCSDININTIDEPLGANEEEVKKWQL